MQYRTGTFLFTSSVRTFKASSGLLTMPSVFNNLIRKLRCKDTPCYVLNEKKLTFKKQMTNMLVSGTYYLSVGTGYPYLFICVVISSMY
jgi:hypothetical protein